MRLAAGTESLRVATRFLRSAVGVCSCCIARRLPTEAANPAKMPLDGMRNLPLILFGATPLVVPMNIHLLQLLRVTYTAKSLHTTPSPLAPISSSDAALLHVRPVRFHHHHHPKTPYPLQLHSTAPYRAQTNGRHASLTRAPGCTRTRRVYRLMHPIRCRRSI